MPIPAYPTNRIPRPFAANGTIAIVPDAKPAGGRASWQEGFPVETQLPLSSGGVAPSRVDFNGIFNALSALAFWQQAGGLWMYSALQDYNTPAVVFYDGKLWFCVAPNGPGTTVPGQVTPGSNEAYWIEFLSWLTRGSSGGGGASLGVPVGSVIMYPAEIPPAGYLPCDGGSFSATDYPMLFALLGKSTTPDMRGLFVRGYDPAGINDPDGATRNLGSMQQDAGRALVASVTGFEFLNPAGAFYTGAATSRGFKNDSDGNVLNFDASRVWGASHTSTEFRPANMNLLYCIKHD